MVTFDAIGTRWQIDVYDRLSAETQATLMHQVHERIALFDRTYSRFRSDSWVAQLAREGGTYAMPADGLPLFTIYETMYRATGGAMTPFIGRTLEQAGYDAQYSLQPGTLTAPPAWDDILTYNAEQVTLAQPALLDFGAAGKGYLIDIVSDLLEQHGVQAYCVDAGGDMRHRNPTGTPLRVGLEDPHHTAHVIGATPLANASLCGSAGNRRAWAQYHHIINPHTLASPQEIAAVWVLAPTTMLADALATALFFVPPERLTTVAPTFAYCMLRADRRAKYSPNFPVEFFV